MKRILGILLFLYVAIFFAACGRGGSSASDEAVYTDTITYMVYIRQQDPTDDYEAYYLSGLDAGRLIERIYSSVYHHQAQAYDFTTGEALSIDDIKTREVEHPEVYSHDNVSVIQFTEAWSYDESALSFKKKVLSIHIGYAKRDETGYIETNYPGFIVLMKE